jgi:hypothetical protein
MNLIDLLNDAETISTCEVEIAGIDALYLVPADMSQLFVFEPDTITDIQTVESAIHIDFDFQSCNFKSRMRQSDAGINYDNSISFRYSKDVTEWLFQNKEKPFFLVFLKGAQWYVSGSDALPYYINYEYLTGKSAGEVQGYDIELISSQLRPLIKYEAPAPPPP